MKEFDGRNGTAGNVTMTDEVVALEQRLRLPDMTGTPEHVAWARTIRAAFLMHAVGRIFKAVAHAEPDSREEMFECLRLTLKETSAARWMNRFGTLAGTATDSLRDLAATGRRLGDAVVEEALAASDLPD